jgi:predicted DNA-binding transcriptional regulator AlpA
MTKESKRRAADAPAMAMSLREFCNRHGFSLSFFYLLEERGQAPRTMQVGGRRLVSIEEAARWREQRIVAA